MGLKDSGLNVCVVLMEIKRSTRIYLRNLFIMSSYYHYLYAVNVNYEECVMLSPELNRNPNASNLEYDKRYKKEKNRTQNI